METKTLTQHMLVEPCHTAESMGSGTLPVLATPALIAFLENTAMKLVDNLPEGETTVGTSMNLQHLKASAVGETIHCEARLTHQEGRRYTFSIKATNSRGETIGEGTHERFAVHAERFMGKLQQAH